METSPFSILNGETTVLNGNVCDLRTFFNFQSVFFCGTLNGLHPFPKNETTCIQNGDVPFFRRYLFIFVVGLARGIRDISIMFASKEWIHHTLTCSNLICVLLKFVVRHWNMNRCFFLAWDF